MSSYGLWLSAAGMKINEYKQMLYANNMANAHTAGFKHDLAMITQRPVESREDAVGSNFAHPVLDGLSGGANVRPSFQNFAQGSIESTGRPFDVAIDGDGFFAVSDGEVTRYTRDGEFVRSASGELVLAAGEGRWRVLSDTGATIAISDEGGTPTFSQDGTIRQGTQVIGKLGLMTTDDKQSLRKVGENLFDAGATEMVSVKPTLRPESRERSNFDVMRGLASMIEATRVYEMNARLLQLQDSMTGQVVSTVGRLA